MTNECISPDLLQILPCDTTLEILDFISIPVLNGTKATQGDSGSGDDQPPFNIYNMIRAMFGRFRAHPCRGTEHVFRSVCARNTNAKIVSAFSAPVAELKHDYAFHASLRALLGRFPALRRIDLDLSPHCYERLTNCLLARRKDNTIAVASPVVRLRFTLHMGSYAPKEGRAIVQQWLEQQHQQVALSAFAARCTLCFVDARLNPIDPPKDRPRAASSA
jgi:hypothetical protein